VKNITSGNRGYRLQQISQASLGAGGLHPSVKLPPGEALNDWMAVAVVDFFNQLSCLLSPITEYCTSSSCPEMTAGPTFKYAWQDNETFQQPTMLPAPEYINQVMDWVETMTSNEKLFPDDPNVPFPTNFLDIVKKIFTRLFRIYAHIYHHHHDVIQTTGVEAYLNTSFRHFYIFSDEFKLIPKDQLQPLNDIITML
jgi:MOB kinase activator 1